jgi:hypothetical protein
MNDTTDYAAIRHDLALLCCSLRGLDPEHVARGETKPQRLSDGITDAVNAVLVLLGSAEAARRHLNDLAARPMAA